MSESSRLEALEATVARLSGEVAALRRDIQQWRGVSASEPPLPSDASRSHAESAPERPAPSGPPGPAEPGSPRRDDTEIFVSEEMRRLAEGVTTAGAHRSRWRREGGTARSPSLGSSLSREGVEALVGRYGTLALAAFTILMGIGAFVGWAIRNGLVGPELRVALGTLASAIVAGVGWRLRRGHSPRFGGVLLALSLAMLHVVCWGAGPLLHLVPDAVALAAATAASAALAGLALREADQRLFNVGFGGALLAPFVTASDAGDPVFLLVYGALVLAAGMRASSARGWGKTPFVLGAGIAGYTAAASGQTAADAPVVREAVPATFALAMGWLALLQVREAARAHLATVALLAALSALGVAGVAGDAAVPGAALALAITVTGFVTGAVAPASRWQRFVGAVVLPFGACLVTVLHVATPEHARQATLVAVWCAASVAAAVANRDGARPLHAFSAIVFGGFVIVASMVPYPRARLLTLSAFCAGAALVMRRFVLREGALAILGWLVVDTVAAWSLLDGRGRWITRPFLTPASGVAAAACAAWLVFSWHWARMDRAPGEWLVGARRTTARLLGTAVTFAWIHTELSHTVSIDVSTFLLVAYYAVSGVLAIGIGRARSIAALRQVGLALAVLAAVRALVETSSMSIGWKVGGYLLAGGFLLGVAYWYRGAGGGRAVPGEE